MKISFITYCTENLLFYANKYFFFCLKLNCTYIEINFQAGKVIQMPVPSSYNDITTSRELRDHVGAVWYEKSFFVPMSWREQRVFVRFGSVNYLAQVVSSFSKYDIFIKNY